jgi:hypothetical protein
MLLHSVGRYTFFAVFLAILPIASASAQTQVGGWLSISATGAAPAVASVEQVSIFPLRQESFEATHLYTEKGKPSFDIDGGVRFGQVGFGLAVSRYADTQKVQSSISIPSVFFFNQPTTAQAVTQNPLAHSETALHLEARYLVNLPHASIAAFGGPTYFRVAHELVTNDSYLETVDFSTGNQTERITGYDSRSVSLRAWGYHVGADIAYYFTDFIGIGTIVRYSHGTTKLPNDIQTGNTGVASTTDLAVGGLEIGGGLRIRF